LSRGVEKEAKELQEARNEKAGGTIAVEPVGCAGVSKKKPKNFKKQGTKAVHPKWDVQKYPITVSIHRSMYAYIYWAWGSSISMHPWFVTVRVFVLIIMTVWPLAL
jgi:hypothetical protein